MRRVAGWLELPADSHDLKDADTLERAAADWLASGRNEAWLLEGTRLAEAESLAANPASATGWSPPAARLPAAGKRSDRGRTTTLAQVRIHSLVGLVARDAAQE
jgi:hypothetical protein